MSKLISLLIGIVIGIIAVTASDWRWMLWSGLSCGAGFIAVFVYSFTDYGPGPFWGGVLGTLGFGAATCLGSLAVWTVLGMCGWQGPGFPPAISVPFQVFGNGLKRALIALLRLALNALE
jgi:hypothetical protein